MSSEKSLTPQIRFKGFTEAWEQRKLSQIVSINGGKDYKYLEAGPIPVYGTGGYMTSVSQALSYNQDAIGIGRKGTIDCPYILKAPFWTIDTLFYSIPINNADLQFTLCLFLNVNWKSKDESTGLPSLSKQTIEKTLVKTPNALEQQKIGLTFSRLNSLITLHQRKLDALKKIKSALLEKMFPKDGSNIPEIRFTGFTEAWEQCKAINLFKDVSEKGFDNLPVLSATQDRGMVYRDENGINISHDKKNELTYKHVIPGQFVIHLRSFQGGFAHSAIEGITSPAYTVFKFSNESQHDDIFWKYIFMSERFIKSLETVTYGIRDGRSISYSEFLGLPFAVPEKEEENRIGHFLKKYDSLITLHQRKLDALKKIKSALLEKMFV